MRNDNETFAVQSYDFDMEAIKEEVREVYDGLANELLTLKEKFLDNWKKESILEVRLLLTEDADRIQQIADVLRKGDWRKAFGMMQMLDTCVRDQIPDGVWNFCEEGIEADEDGEEW